MVVFKGINWIIRYTNLNKIKGDWVSLAIGTILSLLLVSDINPINAAQISKRDYQTKLDPYRSVITWPSTSGYHLDHKGVSNFLLNRLSHDDYVIVTSPTWILSIYHYYLGGVDYFLSTKDKQNYVITNERQYVNYITGSKMITDITQIEKLIKECNNDIWFVGDKRLIQEHINYYPKSIKKYLIALSEDPDYVGRDGNTFTTKLEK